MIRAEQPRDVAAVRAINNAAFSTDAESELVDRLRGSVDGCISLVYEYDNQLIGHIFFSPVHVESNTQNILMCGLAPMAIHPNWQRQGFGSQLVEKGLNECKKQGYQAVVVLGHPEYYPRFGFEVAENYGLTCEFDPPTEAFMINGLIPNTITELSGTVSYHPLFSR